MQHNPSRNDERPRTTKEIDRAIGRRIRSIRILLGFTGKDTAKQVGLTAAQLVQIENGELRVTAAMIYRLSRYFRVPISGFYEGI